MINSIYKLTMKNIWYVYSNLVFSESPQLQRNYTEHKTSSEFMDDRIDPHAELVDQIIG